MKHYIKCWHDWETINEASSEWLVGRHPAVDRIKTNRSDRYKRVEVEPHHFHRFFIKNRHVKNKVCVKCGECIDRITPLREIVFSEIDDAIEKQKNKKKRASLAKKIWRMCEN